MSNTEIKHEFLFKEYELCFEQLRFYDNRSNDLLKYLFTLTTSVAAALFAVFKISNTFDQKYYASLSFLSCIVFISSFLLFMAMVQNRLYFVQIAKQLNAIRGYFTKINPEDGFQNQLYTSTNFPAFKTKSVHTFQIVGAAVLCGLYAGSFTFAVLHDTHFIMSITGWAFVSTFAVTLVCSFGAFIYLSFSGRKSSDEAIHNKKMHNQ
jgi:hypothetical protein